MRVRDSESRNYVQGCAQSCETDYYLEYLNATQSQGVTKPSTWINLRYLENFEHYTFHACQTLPIMLLDACFTFLIMILILSKIFIMFVQTKMNLLRD